MPNLTTIIWASPSALPRPTGDTVIPPTAVPAGASLFRFSALRPAVMPSVTPQVTLIQMSFQRSDDGGVTWRAPITMLDDGLQRVEKGVTIPDMFMEFSWKVSDGQGNSIPDAAGANTMIKGTITLIQGINASGFTLSCQ